MIELVARIDYCIDLAGIKCLLEQSRVIFSPFPKAVSQSDFPDSIVPPSAAFVKDFCENTGRIRTRGRAMTKNKRISGVAVECVVLLLPSVQPEEECVELL